jgi:hypothetical protein
METFWINTDTHTAASIFAPLRDRLLLQLHTHTLAQRGKLVIKKVLALNLRAASAAASAWRRGWKIAVRRLRAQTYEDFLLLFGLLYFSCIPLKIYYVQYEESLLNDLDVGEELLRTIWKHIIPYTPKFIFSDASKYFTTYFYPSIIFIIYIISCQMFLESTLLLKYSTLGAN